ncbi:MAG: ATP-dependent Clp protease ATP-binding subunit ClpX, partial [Planctomycetota bacterium]
LGQKIIGFEKGEHHEDVADDASKDRDKLIPYLDQKDLIDFGLIPEFVGRLPVMAPMVALTKDQIIEVMTTPKNALVKEYQTYFEMDDCKLEFTDESLQEIANIVQERETGVRALRSLFEELLLDVRYTLPNQKETNSFVITKEIVLERLTHEGRRKRKKGPRKTA